MNLDYVPLLHVMRELHSIPRGHPPDFNGMKRFRQYLRTIFPADETADQLLPLLVNSPCGEHGRSLQAVALHFARGLRERQKRNRIVEFNRRRQ